MDLTNDRVKKMARKVVTSKPLKPSAWLLLRQKARNAIIHSTREEIHAAHDRDTKRMELERLSAAIYGTSPGFRQAAHTDRSAEHYMGNATLRGLHTLTPHTSINQFA